MQSCIENTVNRYHRAITLLKTIRICIAQVIPYYTYRDSAYVTLYFRGYPSYTYMYSDFAYVTLYSPGRLALHIHRFHLCYSVFPRRPHLTHTYVAIPSMYLCISQATPPYTYKDSAYVILYFPSHPALHIQRFRLCYSVFPRPPRLTHTKIPSMLLCISQATPPYTYMYSDPA